MTRLELGCATPKIVRDGNVFIYKKKREEKKRRRRFKQALDSPQVIFAEYPPV